MKHEKKIFTLLVLIAISLILYLIFPQDENVTIETKFGNTNHFDVNSTSLEDRFSIEKVSNGSVPTGLDFTPDGRLFFSQLDGDIKYYQNGETNLYATVPDSTIPAVEKGESGPLDMVVDPDFENNPYIYIYYASNGTNKIGRFTDANDTGTDFEIMLDRIKQAKIHNGGRLEFGPDGKIYLGTGDATPIKSEGEGYEFERRKYSENGLFDPEEAISSINPSQKINSKEGKILRLNRDGSIPSDNPFDSHTYAYGFRNVYTLLFANENLYVGDQGVVCCDEINLVEEGQNYGWPLENGIIENSAYTNPIYAWNGEERVSPTGMDFYEDNLFPELNGKLIMGTWKTRQIYVFDIENEVNNVTIYDVPVFQGDPEKVGGILDVKEGPDGNIYFSDIFGVYKLSPKTGA